jgi:hypothetical protein
MPGVELDPAHVRSVRAFRWKKRGDGARQHRGLKPDQVQAALHAAGVTGLVRPVKGWGQTDFVPLRINKGLGLRVLAAELGGTAAREVGSKRLDAQDGRPAQGALAALAVGDTEADIPMLALAEHAWAPAHADAAVRRARAHIARRPYHAGLAEAVGAVLGHKPGGCPVCRLPQLPASARLLTGILSAQESRTPASMAWSGVRLAVAARLLRRSGKAWETTA